MPALRTFSAAEEFEVCEAIFDRFRRTHIHASRSTRRQLVREKATRVWAMGPSAKPGLSLVANWLPVAFGGRFLISELIEFIGGCRRTRTFDPLIKSQLLHGQCSAGYIPVQSIETSPYAQLRARSFRPITGLLRTAHSAKGLAARANMLAQIGDKRDDAGTKRGAWRHVAGSLAVTVFPQRDTAARWSATRG